MDELREWMHISTLTECVFGAKPEKQALNRKKRNTQRCESIEERKSQKYELENEERNISAILHLLKTIPYQALFTSSLFSALLSDSFYSSVLIF